MTRLPGTICLRMSSMTSLKSVHPTNEKLSQIIAKMNVTRGEGPAIRDHENHPPGLGQL